MVQQGETAKGIGVNYELIAEQNKRAKEQQLASAAALGIAIDDLHGLKGLDTPEMRMKLTLEVPVER